MPVMTVLQMRTVRLLDQKVPAFLRPLIRAYFLGYASTTVPRLLTLVLAYLTRSRKTSVEGEQLRFWPSLRDTLRRSLDFHRFPTFCATLVGGSTLLQIPLRRLFARTCRGLSTTAQKRLARWLSSFAAAWLSIKLLQSKEIAAYTKAPSLSPGLPNNDVALRSTRSAGRTLDLTLFAATRAMDVLVGEIWARRRGRRMGAGKWTKAEAAISSLADPSIFASSCALIMWCWIYLPERLPRAYNKWIAGAAVVDPRLITALKRCRWGELVYGQDTGQAPLLQSMCIDYHWPETWGDPSQSIPFPCEMVHMGTGKSCEYHAFCRFLKGFFMAAGMYGPLNVALQIRNPSKSAFKQAFVSTIRSSAFLGSFIALFYYGVCLARTRLGPHIIGSDTQSRQTIDSGLCIGSGCIFCGWSILLENRGRQKDIALFVAPRALATLLPRKYEMKYQWRETAVFAMSTAVVLTCVQENPSRVRGVLGKILTKIIVK